MTKVNAKDCRKFTVVYVDKKGAAKVLEDLMAKDENEARLEFSEVYKDQFTKIAGITDQGLVHRVASIFE